MGSQDDAGRPGSSKTGWTALEEAASDTWAWTRRQFDEAVEATPTVEAWVKAKADEVSGLFDSSEKDDLTRLEEALTSVVAAIQQVSDRQARRMVSLLISKLGAAATIGGITGLITAFGTASTGTLIGSLSGAAATTAKLYWIGSLVGLGTTAGGFILAATGIGVGVAAAYFGRKALMGSQRKPEDLQDYEAAIVSSCVTVLQAIQEQREAGEEASQAEMKLLAEHALVPLVRELDMHWNHQRLEEADVDKVEPFADTLAPLSLRKLRLAKDELTRLAVRAMA